MMDSVRVLVVEDDPSIQAILEAALEDAGFRIDAKSTAEAAIAVLEAAEPAYTAVMTDINLAPRGDTGWDVGRRARELNPAVAIVYMTGDAAADWPSHGVPGSILLSKPFAPAQAVTAISQLLNTAAPPGA